MTDSRNSLTGAAFRLAASWGTGHVIDGEPAIAHASRVARTLRRFVPDAPAEVLAAALLHDAPDLAPESVDVYGTLAYLSPEVARIVAELHAEHEALDRGAATPPVDHLVMLASTADKIVSLRSVLHRGRTSRPAFRAALHYLHSFSDAARYRVPEPMAAELAELVELAATPAPQAPPRRSP